MIQRVLNSKNFLAVLLALATGTLQYIRMLWPITTALAPQTWNEYFLQMIALRDPWTFAGLKADCRIMLFTASGFGHSFLLSALYIFALRPMRTGKPQALPISPFWKTVTISLVNGEIHNPRLPIPAENPSWLIIPERGLFTGTIIVGAIGSGKTGSCMYPFAEQLRGFAQQIPKPKPVVSRLRLKATSAQTYPRLLFSTAGPTTTSKSAWIGCSLVGKPLAVCFGRT